MIIFIVKQIRNGKKKEIYLQFSNWALQKLGKDPIIRNWR